jgi:hypothetical protein
MDVYEERKAQPYEDVYNEMRRALSCIKEAFPLFEKAVGGEDGGEDFDHLNKMIDMKKLIEDRIQNVSNFLTF